MTGLKTKENIFTPDPRTVAFRNYLPNIQSYIDYMNRAALSDRVTKEVRECFDRARNTFVYSYYQYDLSMPAQLYALSTFELALKVRLHPFLKSKRRIGMGTLIQYAKQRDLLSFKNILDEPTKQRALSRLQFWAPHRGYKTDFEGYRNHLAHGADALDLPGHAAENIIYCAYAIESLFVD